MYKPEDLSDSELHGAIKELIQVRHDVIAEFIQLEAEAAEWPSTLMALGAARTTAVRAIADRMEALMRIQNRRLGG